MPALERLIQYDKPRILINVLHSVLFMLTDQSYKVANIYHCQPIRSRLLQLVGYSDKAVRTLSVRALAFLCSSNNNHFVTNLLQSGLLESLYKSICTYEQSQQEKITFLWMCENILKNSNDDLFTLVHHQCINKLFEYAHPSEESRVRSQALYTMRIMFEFAAYNQIELLFRLRTDLLDMLVHNLTNPS